MTRRFWAVRAGERRRKWFRRVRTAGLLVLLVEAARLNSWSRQGDPRFYAFLNSAGGAACARVFGWWSSPLERPVPDRADARLSARERDIKATMQHGLDQCTGHPGSYRVQYRDILFRQEYAETPLHLYPPYLIVSELPAPVMDRTMGALSDVYSGFLEQFGPLVTRDPRGELIHLLCFASQADYADYQRRYARWLEDTSGFYSPSVNRLVLYRDPGDESSLPLLTIRHEAAHQLFYAYGVHSVHNIENDWLIEGLACYCETPRVGGSDAGQVSMLLRALANGTTLPLSSLINHHGQDGLLACKPAELAYAQAWSLVHLLMTDAFRDRFFNYIRFVRAPESFPAVRTPPRIELLCRHLQLSPDALQTAWEDHLGALAAAHRVADAGSR